MNSKRTLIVAAIVAIFALVSVGIQSCNLVPSVGKRFTLEFPQGRSFQDPSNIYRLSGTGPNGVTFGPQTYSIQTTSEVLDDIALGTWTFLFEETDAAGQVVYFSTTFTVDVKAGINDVTINVAAPSTTVEIPSRYLDWNFDDGLDAFQISGQAVSSTTDRFGLPNRAANFDGNGYLTIASNPSGDIPNSGGFAISLWIKGPPAPEDRVLLTNKGDNGFVVQFTNKNGGSALSLEVVGGLLGANIPCTDLNKDWNHIVISLDFEKTGDNTDVYFNGIDQNFVATATSSQFVGDSDVWEIGGFSSRITQKYRGTLDDIGIFHAALGSAEVSALYQATGPLQESYTPFDPLPPVGNLVGEWLFTGGSLADSSGNGANLTATGTTATIDRFGQSNARKINGEADTLTSAQPMPGPLGAANLSPSFTLSWWMQRDASSGNIFERDDSYRVRFADGGNYLTIAHGSSEPEYASISTVPFGQWVQATMTYDASATNQLRVYINGRQVYVDSASIPTVTENPLVIGKSGAQVGAQILYFDDLRIYNKALSADEVYAQYALK